MDNVVKLMMAGLKFKGAGIAEVAGDEENTNPATMLIGFSVLLGTVLALIFGNGGSSGVGRMGLTGMTAAMVELGSLLIGTFLSAYIMTFVIRIFKVTLTYNEVLRIYGAAIIWTILKMLFGLIIDIVAPGSMIGMGGVLFWLAYNFAVLFGLTAYARINGWKSFLSIVLTFAVVFIIMLPYGSIVGALFAK